MSHRKSGLARIGVAVVGVTTALTMGLWAQATAAQPSAPAQRIAGPPATASAPAPSASAGGSTITITAVDYAFEGVPARVPVGTTFTMVNASPVELHELVAIRIADRETRSVEELIQLSDEEVAAVTEEMPAMVLIAPPNAPSMAVLGTGTFTAPGRYALVCFIPTGADPQEFLAAAAESTDGPPQVAGGPPHAFLGMVGEVVVE